MAGQEEKPKGHFRSIRFGQLIWCFFGVGATVGPLNLCVGLWKNKNIFLVVTDLYLLKSPEKDTTNVQQRQIPFKLTGGNR